MNARHLVSVGAVAVFTAAGCSDRKPAEVSAAHSSPFVGQPAAVVNGPPPSLMQVGDSAEDLFDAARLSNWTDAAVALGAMKEAAANPRTIRRVMRQFLE